MLSFANYEQKSIRLQKQSDKFSVVSEKIAHQLSIEVQSREDINVFYNYIKVQYDEILSDDFDISHRSINKYVRLKSHEFTENEMPEVVRMAIENRDNISCLTKLLYGKLPIITKNKDQASNARELVRFNSVDKFIRRNL
jgi:hypothetical protein